MLTKEQLKIKIEDELSNVNIALSFLNKNKEWSITTTVVITDEYSLFLTMLNLLRNGVFINLIEIEINYLKSGREDLIYKQQIKCPKITFPKIIAEVLKDLYKEEENQNE